jgi:hypothetical protein
VAGGRSDIDAHTEEPEHLQPLDVLRLNVSRCYGAMPMNVIRKVVVFVHGRMI